MKKNLLVLFGMLALSVMPAVADTISFEAVRARCDYRPDGNQAVDGVDYYYTIVTFFNTEEDFPQLQIHVLTQDTMAITREDNYMVKIGYFPDAAHPARGVEGTEVTLDFVAYRDGVPYYSCDYAIVLADSTVVEGGYEGEIRFFNGLTNAPYIPTNEKAPDAPEAIEQVEPTASLAPTKVLRNGQLLIIRDNRTYDLNGRLVAL